ncbi:MAG: hypothetical protein ABI873_18365 [Marmoricola sp.]
MRARALLGTVAIVGLLATGCGSGTATGSHQSAGHDMSGSAMNMDMSTGHGPSDSAAMICAPEIRKAVQRTFATTHKPRSVHSWSKSDRVYSCSYGLSHGNLAMSVQDSLDKNRGRAYFDALRQRLAGATTIRGLENFGFPAFKTSSGNVVFLKDGKTLQVDASAVPAKALPHGFSREEAAFSVASAVVACWTE